MLYPLYFNRNEQSECPLSKDFIYHWDNNIHHQKAKVQGRECKWVVTEALFGPSRSLLNMICSFLWSSNLDSIFMNEWKLLKFLPSPQIHKLPIIVEIQLVFLLTENTLYLHSTNRSQASRTNTLYVENHMEVSNLWYNYACFINCSIPMHFDILYTFFVFCFF